MDKETLSNYGWIVICVLVLAVMIALAGPFGTFVAGAVKSTTAGLFGVNQNALGAAGITIGDQVFENCEHLETELRNVTDTYTGDTCCKACGAVLSAGQTVRAKVPEGGKYTAADGSVYNPGDEMPKTVTDGDVYTYSNYKYIYKATYVGWDVKCIKNIADPGPILESVNGAPITSMYYTFNSCSGLTTAPKIPDTVTTMEYTFYGCSALKTYADNIDGNGDFSSYVIPNGVTYMVGTFAQCTSIVKAPVIPNSVTYMNSAFYECKSLTTAPAIPNGVTNMGYCFYDTAIITAPEIPSSVTVISWTFEKCASLTGNIIINTNNINKNSSWGEGSCYRCFANVNMSNITLSGSASKDVLNLIGSTGVNWTPIS